MQRNRRKQQNGKDQRSLQENWRYQTNISCRDGHDKRPKQWALGSITMNKASGGDGIPAELFQILKDDAVKVLHSICQHIQKTQQWPQDWKRSVFTPILKKVNAKECLNYHTIVLISHASKVTLKILQAIYTSAVCEMRTSRCRSWNQKRQRNQRSNCQHSFDHGKSKRVPEKTSTSALLIVPKSNGLVPHWARSASRLYIVTLLI